MYRRDGDTITITLTADQFDGLLLALGTAAGAAFVQGAPRHGRAIILLCNAINDGNPAYLPYELPPEKEPDT